MGPWEALKPFISQEIPSTCPLVSLLSLSLLYLLVIMLREARWNAAHILGDENVVGWGGSEGVI